MPKINCTVDACTYWGSGNVCRAREILVTINEGTGGTAETEFAQMGKPRKARTAYETQCKTFKPREDRRTDRDR